MSVRVKKITEYKVNFSEDVLLRALKQYVREHPDEFQGEVSMDGAVSSMDAADKVTLWIYDNLGGKRVVDGLNAEWREVQE